MNGEIDENRIKELLDSGLRKDALELVKINGMFFQQLKSEWRNDKEILIEALKSQVWSIQFASQKFRLDEEIAFLTLSISPYTLFYFPELSRKRSFWSKFSHIKLTIGKNNVLNYAKEDYKTNPDLIYLI